MIHLSSFESTFKGKMPVTGGMFQKSSSTNQDTCILEVYTILVSNSGLPENTLSIPTVLEYKTHHPLPGLDKNSIVNLILSQSLTSVDLNQKSQTRAFVRRHCPTRGNLQAPLAASVRSHGDLGLPFLNTVLTKKALTKISFHSTRPWDICQA